MRFKIGPIGTISVKRQEMKAPRRRIKSGALVALEMIIIHKVYPAVIEETPGFDLK